MRDVHAVVRAYLAAQSDLTDVVGARIYAGRDVPPVDYTPEGSGPCVVFKVRGGAGQYQGRDYEDALIIPSFQFKCYGYEEIEAFQVYRLLVDVLHGQHSGTILHAQETGVGQSLEEPPPTEWRFVLCFFELMIRSA